MNDIKYIFNSYDVLYVMCITIIFKMNGHKLFTMVLIGYRLSCNVTDISAWLQCSFMLFAATN